MSLQYYFSQNDNKPELKVSKPLPECYLLRYGLDLEEIKHYFRKLSSLPWLVQEIIVAGKSYLPKRETLAFADDNSKQLLEQTSSKGMTFPDYFYELREKIQNILLNNIDCIDTIPEMNYCWGNRYRDGYDKVGKHKDDEKGHSKVDPIVSVSFGQTRYFDIYNDDTKILRLNLVSGDILLMMPNFQQLYYHAVPQQKTISGTRINLTFRSKILD